MIIPDAVRGLSSLSRIDYVDRFGVTTDRTASPERWARAMFGDVPSVGELVIWRGLLGLRLSRERSPETVAGWRIGDRGDTWIRLEAASWFLAADLLVETGPGQVTLTTFVRYDRPPARLLWSRLSAVHRHLVPGVLRSAAGRISRSRPDAVAGPTP